MCQQQGGPPVAEEVRVCITASKEAYRPKEAPFGRPFPRRSSSPIEGILNLVVILADNVCLVLGCRAGTLGFGTHPSGGTGALKCWDLTLWGPLMCFSTVIPCDVIADSDTVVVWAAWL